MQQYTKMLATLFAGAPCSAVPAVHTAATIRVTEQTLQTSTSQQKQQVPAADKTVSSSAGIFGNLVGSEPSAAGSTN